MDPWKRNPQERLDDAKKNKELGTEKFKVCMTTTSCFLFYINLKLYCNFVYLLEFFRSFKNLEVKYYYSNIFSVLSISTQRLTTPKIS